MGDDNMLAEAATNMDKVRLDAFQLVTMAAIPGTVAALARLNIFQALAQAGDDALLTAAELAALALPGKAINLTYLARLLRMMAAKKILREAVTLGDDGVAIERRFGLEPIARYLVDDPDNGSFLGFLETSSVFSQTWEHIHESVLDDAIAPFVRTHGVDVFEYGKQNPAFGKAFNKAMAGHSEVFMRTTLDVYHGFEGVNVLVDVGGGFGSSLRLITAKYPHVKGINFDQPHVIDGCAPLPGVEHVSGDMFVSVPSGGDAIFMKYILHDWDDETCVKILKNCYKALPPHGKVVVMDHVLPEIIDFEGGDHMAIQTDVQMLLCSSGACERTERHVRKLGLAAGFKQVNLICKANDLYGITEFHKSA